MYVVMVVYKFVLRLPRIFPKLSCNSAMEHTNSAMEHYNSASAMERKVSLRGIIWSPDRRQDPHTTTDYESSNQGRRARTKMDQRTEIQDE
jgi:hypothetical protein